ncbi:hypothetical protein [Uliginosibacterium sp. 31-12]|uniref:hypothetical protein n=1 Tax=Uliginosibacterium sp. 31-12 TaxID=3062781 RepID=UPI0026E1391E|nr:hypothetical protein [Uliginosibacterium sp. 31-12]MDO6385564.1 hypothetical protein [Uliginosibacterium sp. 31-12]
MSRILIIAAILLMMPACNPQIVREEVPVSVPCLGPAPQAPAYQFGTGEYPGETAASRVLLSDLNAAKAYAAELVTQMAGCR